MSPHFHSRIMPARAHASAVPGDRVTLILIWCVIALAAVYFVLLYLVSTG